MAHHPQSATRLVALQRSEPFQHQGLRSAQIPHGCSSAIPATPQTAGNKRSRPQSPANPEQLDQGMAGGQQQLRKQRLTISAPLPSQTPHTRLPPQEASFQHQSQVARPEAGQVWQVNSTHIPGLHWTIRLIQKLRSGSSGNVWLVEVLSGLNSAAAGVPLAAAAPQRPNSAAPAAKPCISSLELSNEEKAMTTLAASLLASLPGTKVAIKLADPGPTAAAAATAAEATVMYKLHSSQPDMFPHIFDHGFGTPTSGATYEAPVIMMEYLSGGSLLDELKQMRSKGTYMAPECVRALMRRLARGLDIMHSECVLHRDLKSSSLLLQSLPGGSSSCKIAGLGSAHQLLHPADRAMTFVGTDGFVAPEVAANKMKEDGSWSDPTWYSYPADVYSFGMLFLEIRFMGSPPYAYLEHLQIPAEEKAARKKNEQQELFQPGSPYSKLSHIEREFAYQCLQQKANQRPSIWLLMTLGAYLQKGGPPLTSG